MDEYLPKIHLKDITDVRAEVGDDMVSIEATTQRKVFRMNFWGGANDKTRCNLSTWECLFAWEEPLYPLHSESEQIGFTTMKTGTLEITKPKDSECIHIITDHVVFYLEIQEVE